MRLLPAGTVLLAVALLGLDPAAAPTVTACRVDRGVPGHLDFTTPTGQLDGAGARPPALAIAEADARTADNWIDGRAPTVTIGYTNAATVALRSVDVALVERPFSLTDVHDVRLVAPGAHATATFPLDRSVLDYLEHPPDCVVVAATFADGSRWTNPDAPESRP